jgi:hypothetical protein
VLGIGGSGVIVFYISRVLAVPDGYISAGLTYVRFVAGFTCQSVDPTFVVV